MSFLNVNRIFVFTCKLICQHFRPFIYNCFLHHKAVRCRKALRSYSFSRQHNMHYSRDNSECDSYNCRGTGSPKYPTTTYPFDSMKGLWSSAKESGLKMVLRDGRNMLRCLGSPVQDLKFVRAGV